MKQCEHKRNLAFYKRSGEPWTPEQYKAVCEYVGDEGQIAASDSHERRYIFDNGDEALFLYPWASQESHYNFKNCKQVAYEDIFNEDGTVKGEQMKEEVVRVGSKKELAELLISGGKWTSDELGDDEYCYYDEGYSTPFRLVYDEYNENMSGAWDIKTWRKVKPQFKKYDVVMCWDNGSGYSVIDIWNETGVFTGFPNSNLKVDNVEPYTGPVPKHIQDFIDDMKAKEK